MAELRAGQSDGLRTRRELFGLGCLGILSGQARPEVPAEHSGTAPRDDCEYYRRKTEVSLAIIGALYPAPAHEYNDLTRVVLEPGTGDRLHREFELLHPEYYRRPK